MRKSASHLISALVLVFALGLHWGLLQTVAWVGMVARFSASQPLSTAITRTFEGKSPCSLCKVVEKGKRNQPKTVAPEPGQSLDLLLALPGRLVFSAPFPQNPQTGDPVWRVRLSQPPIPPPRFV